MTNSTDLLQSYLSFRLGDELFAANVTKVLEILEIPRITKVPKSPDYLRGVINLRGAVLPVVDSRIKFGLPKVEDSVNSCIIVLSIAVSSEIVTIGIIVDSVQEVLELEQQSIQDVPSIGSKYKSEFIDGMVKVNEQFIMLINLDKVFSLEEMSILSESNSHN